MPPRDLILGECQLLFNGVPVGMFNGTTQMFNNLADEFCALTEATIECTIAIQSIRLEDLKIWLGGSIIYSKRGRKLRQFRLCSNRTRRKQRLTRLQRRSKRQRKKLKR